VIGTIDELNSHLGAVVASFKKTEHQEFGKQTVFLEKIQHELFNLGGEVAGAPVTISKEFLATIEKTSKSLQKIMKKNWHHQFVLPGGHEIAAQLDIARSVCRRLERRIVSLKEKRTISDQVLKTANRLSDYLYVLRCFANQVMGKKEQYFTRD
jgi:cob(I)alamin adenosyltransferase